MAQVTFLQQNEPLDEYGRALYAISRSIIRALIDQLGSEDLADLNCDLADVTWRQLCKVARLERDKGMRGDGFEWAVHEAIIGGEPLVTDIVADAMRRASPRLRLTKPTSLLFGHERARYLGFLEAVIDNAGDKAKILPDGAGHPYEFGKWVAIAAEGKAAEPNLTARIKQIWKTDLFLGDESSSQFVASTVKSNWLQLEAGRGLRVGIVPEAKDLPKGFRKHANGLYLAVLPDPNGFMGAFNDAYMAVAGAVCALGRHPLPPYYAKPSATAQRVQEQLEKYPTAKVVEIEHELDRAAQQNLIKVNHTLLSVQAPPWLHIKEKQAVVIAPKPSFEKL